jgi:hypothetical protein
MKVEELSQYGVTLSEIPKDVRKKQARIMLHEIHANYGWLGTLPFILRTILGQRKLKSEYPEAYKKALSISESAANEFTMLASMFKQAASTDGKQRAYEFLKGIFQKMAVYTRL